MQVDLQGKIAIVTGAAQGIGKAIAETFARNGATVVLSDVLAEVGAATTAAIGGSATFVPCDISDLSQVEALIGGAVERFGHLDVMVNNAGVNASKDERGTTDRFPLKTWRKIIDVDLNGTFYCCRTAAAQMVKQKSGNIINIASVAGVVALRLQVAFVAAKAGVIKMTEAMACELGPLGIRVNTVSPGSTLVAGTRDLFYADKEMSSRLLSFIPQGRPGEVEDIANAVAFLASDASDYINGHNLVVDGGWTSGFNRDF